MNIPENVNEVALAAASNCGCSARMIGLCCVRSAVQAAAPLLVAPALHEAADLPVDFPAFVDSRQSEAHEYGADLLRRTIRAHAAKLSRGDSTP